MSLTLAYLGIVPLLLAGVLFAWRINRHYKAKLEKMRLDHEHAMKKLRARHKGSRR